MSDRTAFDLFQFLGELSKRDLNAFNKLSPEGQKAAHPFVVMRWLSGTSDRAQLVRLNTFANRYMFALGEHKSLLFKLLAASATGKTHRYRWIKGPGQTNTKLAVLVISQKYNVSTREAQEYLELLDEADLLGYATDLGWVKEECKKLSLELGKEDESRRASKVVRKSKN